MKQILVGTGGWAYFPSHGVPRLKSYSKIFNFTEVNSTFYDYPNPESVDYWRRTVPNDFVFSVRCHQDLTHRVGLKTSDEAYVVLKRMLKYCEILKAPFLVLETPASYSFTDEKVNEAADLLSSFDLGPVRLVWENRSPPTQKWREMLEDLNIVHSVDISREAQFFETDVLYSRLFGKGIHNMYQFSDEELEEIAHKVLMSKAKTVSLSYHGVRMNSDAMRYVHYSKTGVFPRLTPFVGVESAKAVLAEDTTFPASKNDLLRTQGWKVFDATSEKRIHLSDWLQSVPDKIYTSLEDLATTLEAQQ